VGEVLLAAVGVSHIADLCSPETVSDLLQLLGWVRFVSRDIVAAHPSLVIDEALKGRDSASYRLLLIVPGRDTRPLILVQISRYRLEMRLEVRPAWQTGPVSQTVPACSLYKDLKLAPILPM